MARIIGPECAVMCNLINIYPHTNKKRKKPHKSCRRHVGNGGDLSGKREKNRK